MYAKIPFNSGWSSSDLMSVFQYLLAGNTSVASLPFGVKATAEIINTIPYGWTVDASSTSRIICNAPILGRTNKRKYMRIDVSGTQIFIRVGDSVVSDAIKLDGSDVSYSAQLWNSTLIPTTYSILLHVFITPERFITTIERLSNTNPITFAGLTHFVSGVCDADFNDAHYSDVGSLLPFAVIDKMDSGSTTNTIITVPKRVAGPRALPGFSTYQKGEFVIAGEKSSPCIIPNTGYMVYTTGPSQQQLFELGVSSDSGDPVTGKFNDLYVAMPAYVPHTESHTINSKPYLGVAVNGTTNTLLIPKE